MNHYLECTEQEKLDHIVVLWSYTQMSVLPSNTSQNTEECKDDASKFPYAMSMSDTKKALFKHRWLF